jgi:hypothetical protein
MDDSALARNEPTPNPRALAFQAAGVDPQSRAFMDALGAQLMDAIVDERLASALAMLAACPQLALADLRKAGRGALHWSCSSPSMAPCAKALLALGAAPSGCAGEAAPCSESPLRWAAEAGSIDAVHALIQAGARPQLSDLFAACRRAHGGCAMALAQANPDLDPFAPLPGGLLCCFDELARACDALAFPFNEWRLQARQALAFFERQALQGSAGCGAPCEPERL